MATTRLFLVFLLIMVFAVFTTVARKNRRMNKVTPNFNHTCPKINRTMICEKFRSAHGGFQTSFAAFRFSDGCNIYSCDDSEPGNAKKLCRAARKVRAEKRKCKKLLKKILKTLRWIKKKARKQRMKARKAGKRMMAKSPNLKCLGFTAAEICKPPAIGLMYTDGCQACRCTAEGEKNCRGDIQRCRDPSTDAETATCRKIKKKTLKKIKRKSRSQQRRKERRHAN